MNTSTQQASLQCRDGFRNVPASLMLVLALLFDALCMCACVHVLEGEERREVEKEKRTMNIFVSRGEKQENFRFIPVRPCLC